MEVLTVYNSVHRILSSILCDDFRFITKVSNFPKTCYIRVKDILGEFLRLYGWEKNVYPHSKAERLEKKCAPCLQ